jgi:hypothetical protein
MESSPALPADMNLPDCAGHVAKSIRDPYHKSFVFTKLVEAYGRHSRNGNPLGRYGVLTL